MATIYLGLGSNIDPVANLRLAVRQLRRRFGMLDLSAVYRSAPVGFDGDDFLNLVVRANSDLSPADVVRELDAIHVLARRERESDGDRILPRTLDIDLLLYDRRTIDEDDLQLPRTDVLEYDFVLRPLSELAPDYRHPLTGRRLSEHWREFDVGSRVLVREAVRFD